VNAGQAATVGRWLDALLEAVVRGDPRLCLVRAGTLLTLGRRELVEPWLQAAEQGDPAGRPMRGAASIEAEAAIYRAVASYMTGDVERAMEAATRAVELEREDRSPWRAMASAALGRTLFWSGDLDGAVAPLREAVRFAQPPRNNLSVIGALGYLAAIGALRGEPDEAEALADEALSASAGHGLAEHWVSVPALVARATALEQRGRLDEAAGTAERAVELARRGAGQVEMAFALLTLAAVADRRGERDRARGLVAEARERVERCASPGALAGMLERCERTVQAARPRPRPVADRDELTERELAVLRLLPTELSLREIGRPVRLAQHRQDAHARHLPQAPGLDARGGRRRGARARPALTA